MGREDFPRYLRALGRPPDLAGFFPSKSYDLGAFYQRAGHPTPEMLLRCRSCGRDCGPENSTTVSASTTTMAKATTTAGSAQGRTHSSPSPGWLCPGQGLGRTPRAEQVLGPWGVQAVGRSAAGLRRLWDNGGVGGTVPAVCPSAPGAWQSSHHAAPGRLLLPTLHPWVRGEAWWRWGVTGGCGAAAAVQARGSGVGGAMAGACSSQPESP